MPNGKAKATRPSTRERILDAALDLFVEEGYSGATITEVERRVGLAAGTGSFYRHFASKEELLTAVVEHEIARCLAESDAERASLVLPDDPRGQFVAGANQILRDLVRFDRLFHLMLSDGDRLPDVRKTINTALQGSGALSWLDQPSTVVVIAAMLGYHLFDVLGDAPTMGKDEFIDALAALVAPAPARAAPARAARR